MTALRSGLLHLHVGVVQNQEQLRSYVTEHITTKLEASAVPARVASPPAGASADGGNGGQGDNGPITAAGTSGWVRPDGALFAGIAQPVVLVSVAVAVAAVAWFALSRSHSRGVVTGGPPTARHGG